MDHGLAPFNVLGDMAVQLTPDLGLGPRIGLIDAWAVERLETLDPARLALPARHLAASTADADQLFREIVGLNFSDLR